MFVRLLKELSQFLIGVSLFDRFLVFDRGHDNRSIILLPTPLQKSPQNPGITADGVMGQAALSHGDNDIVDIVLCHISYQLVPIQMLSDRMPVLMVVLNGAFADSLCCLCGYEPWKEFV